MVFFMVLLDQFRAAVVQRGILNSLTNKEPDGAISTSGNRSGITKSLPLFSIANFLPERL
jgi:hypothetical protein